MDKWSQFHLACGTPPHPPGCSYDYHEEEIDIEISEVILDQQLHSYRTKSYNVRSDNLESWLDDNQSAPDLQLVWVRWKQLSKFFIRKEDEEQILASFGLRSAQQYAQVTRYCFTTFNSPSEPLVNVKSYLVKCNRFTLAWSYDETSGKTRGVYRGDEWFLNKLERLLDSLKGPIIRHPLFLAEAACMLLGIYIDRHISIAERKIRPVEERTGFGGSFATIRPAEKALGELSAQMSGVKSELAAVEGTLKFNKRLNLFIPRHLQDDSDSPATDLHPVAFQSGKEMLIMSCKGMNDRLDYDHERLEEYVKRAETQLIALFHLITQEDTRASLAIAQESKALAEAAKRDSDAMKTLSVVTMVFLPGTAVATVFAMPFFTWNPGQSGALVDPNFWIYWVIVIPLTIVTLLVWWLWIRRQTLLRKTREISAPDDDQKEKKEGFYHSLCS